MDEKSKDSIIDDLLKKNPSQIYEDADLFGLGFRSSYDVRNYLRERFFKGRPDLKLGRKKATLTRRTNRIWLRINASIWRQAANGGEGIYRVSDPGDHLYGTLGYVFASSKIEAKKLAELLFNYSTAKGKNANTQFIAFGLLIDLLPYNQYLRQGIEESIDRLCNTVRAHSQRIEQLKNRLKILNQTESDQL